MGQTTQSCFQANISNGSNEPNHMLFAQNGTVNCLDLVPATAAVTVDTSTAAKPTIGGPSISGTGWSKPSNYSWLNTASVSSPASTSAVSIDSMIPRTGPWSKPSNYSWLNTTSVSSPTSSASAVSTDSMTARAAKNIPQSCLAMAAVLATVAYT